MSTDSLPVRFVVCGGRTVARDTARLMGWRPENLRFVESPDDMFPYNSSKLILMENWWMARNLRVIITQALGRGLTLEYVQRGHFNITWDEVKHLTDDQIRVYGDCKYYAFGVGLILNIESIHDTFPSTKR